MGLSDVHVLDGSSASSRYEVRGKLGAGGGGVVYLAFDRERGTEVALKVLNEVTGLDVYRFKREFRALADIAHPNLVGLYELHTIGGEWFLTMELVVGVSFTSWVRPGSEVVEPAPQASSDVRTPSATELHDPTAQTATVSAAAARNARSGRHRMIEARVDLARLEEALYQLCDTVHALHLAGKLHRDLKPSNVLVEADGRLVLLDFGLVADVEVVDLGHTHESKFAVGTPAYMSPEQAANLPLSRASDWYSVGVMLYEALTGRRPFDAADHRGLAGPLLPPVVYNPDAPPKLAELAVALLATDPTRRPGGEAVLAALGREPSAASNELAISLQTAPFVGREHELEALGAGLERVRAGAGVAVLVRAVSGMGKSTLLRRFLDKLAAEAPDVVVLRGRCYERESVPFKTLDTVVDALTTHLMGLSGNELEELLPADVEALGRLFPATRRVRQIAEPQIRTLQPPDPIELRRRAFGALRSLLANLARRAPLVVALDDLQWGDADSGNFLAELLLQPDAPPILLLLAHRQEDEASSALLAALRRARSTLASERPGAMSFEQLTLEPLSEREAARLVRLVGGHRDPARARAVVRDARGSPLFLSEMVRSGVSASSLDESIRARVERLPEGARTLVQLCAIAAKPLAQTIAVRAARLRDGGTFLAQLRVERLVRVRRSGDAEPELEVYHDRIRAAIVTGLPRPMLEALHRRLASTLESAPRPDHEALVGHWLGAGEPPRAAIHAALAAEAAEERLAFHSAADLYAFALKHGAHDAATAHALRTRMGHALVHSGQLAAAADAFAEAAATATSRHDLLELRGLELEQRLRCSQLEAGLALAGELLEGLGFHVPTSRGRALAAMLWQRLRLRLRGLHYVERSEATVAPEALQRLDILLALSNGLSFSSPVYGRALQTRLVRESLDVGEPHRVGIAFSLETGYLGTRGARGYPAAKQLGERTVALGRRLGDPSIEGHGLANIALSAYLSGLFRESLERARAAERALRNHTRSARWILNLTEYFIATMNWCLGDVRELVRLVALYLRDAEDRGDLYAQRALRGWRTNVAWLVVGQPDEARAQLASVATPPLEHGQPAQVSHYYDLMSDVQIDLYQGEGQAALARVEALWPALHSAMLLRIQSIHIEAHFLRARAALAAARASAPDAAARHLQVVRSSARALDRASAPWASAVATIVRAGGARLGGDADQEASLLQAAATRLDAAGMELFAAATRHRLGVCLGGDQGAALTRAAEELFVTRGVADPAALRRVLLGIASE